jgi:hypothetical protein
MVCFLGGSEEDKLVVRLGNSQQTEGNVNQDKGLFLDEMVALATQRCHTSNWSSVESSWAEQAFLCP